jgi:hypothetical protein
MLDQSALAQRAMVEMHNLITECDKAAKAITDLIGPQEEDIVKLDVEIAVLEGQLAREVDRPGKRLDVLQDKLSRLRLQRTVAEKERVRALERELDRPPAGFAQAKLKARQPDPVVADCVHDVSTRMDSAGNVLD